MYKHIHKMDIHINVHTNILHKRERNIASNNL